MERTVLNGGKWEFKQYGRLKEAGQSEETASWKIFQSSEESGRLTLTILNTGHFFISQEHTMLEGFSLISAQTCLRKSDLLLLESNAKNLQMYVDVQNGSLMESSERYTEGRLTSKQIAQSVLNKHRKELDTSENLVLSSEEFLLDQHFPAFAESVEKELHKVAEN
ncbi:hypothetical protein XELAEV_18020785mg [Xenopus laevis]|uniref:Uncharacterized protein n=1 Tax=Xenopus laevis TaxID=8355 RepID=A0A974HRB9_XENLA|nr:hypothetical protein XELAEV_18020785mg [Xenopus laevis]